MRKKNSSFDWSHAQAFLATAETGSLSGAAKLLGSSQPTISRHVASLEQDLGLKLFDRVGKSLLINDQGLSLLTHVKSMQESADLLGLSVSGQNQAISGSVTITASDVFCAYLLPPIAARITQTYPEIRLEIISSNEVQDLRRREADIAIRNTQPKHPDLYAKRIRETKAHLYGATSYLDELGRPEKVEDLSSNVSFIGDMNGRVLQAVRALNPNIRPEQFNIIGNDGVVLWEMVKQGLGLALMFDDLAQITPEAEAILHDQISAEVPIWLVTHAELKTSAKIRAIYDILSEELA